jgi:hypothetical protein
VGSSGTLPARILPQAVNTSLGVMLGRGFAEAFIRWHIDSENRPLFGTTMTLDAGRGVRAPILSTTDGSFGFLADHFPAGGRFAHFRDCQEGQRDVARRKPAPQGVPKGLAGDNATLIPAVEGVCGARGGHPKEPSRRHYSIGMRGVNAGERVLGRHSWFPVFRNANRTKRRRLLSRD